MRIVLLLFLSSVGLAQQSYTTTSGPCSPIAPNNSGSITINCPKLSKEDRDALIKRLNEVFGGDFNSIMTTLGKIQSEVNTTGVLEPDTRPDPAGSKPDTVLNVYLGTNLVAVYGDRCTLLKVGDEDMLWIERASTGIMVSARVFDPNSHILATIDKNNVTVNPNNTFRREIGKHTLLVVNESNQAALHVYFVNPHTMAISGLFNSAQYGRIDVTNDMLFDEHKRLGFSYTRQECRDGGTAYWFNIPGTGSGAAIGVVPMPPPAPPPHK